MVEPSDELLDAQRETRALVVVEDVRVRSRHLELGDLADVSRALLAHDGFAAELGLERAAPLGGRRVTLFFIFLNNRSLT